MNKKEMQALKIFLGQIDFREYRLDEELKTNKDLESAFIKLGLISK
jgi:hypothetical protein